MDAARLSLITMLVTGAMFMEILDASIITTALPSMARSFGTTALELNLGISAYLLALGVFIPASGWIAERFGARTVFSSAICLFMLSSALCGLSTGLDSFVAIRIFQGASGALMVPVGRLMVLKFTPQDRLMAALSSLIWPALIAPVIGPPLGGFITTHIGWRWIFYLNVPLGTVALIMALALVPNAREDQPRRFDWTGFVLCGAGTFLLLGGLERLTQALSIVNFGVVACGAALSSVAIAHFRRAANPMLRLSAFSIPTFRASQRGGLTTRMAIGTVPFILPLMFQVGFGYDAFHSGLLLLAVFAGNVGMKAITTRILRRFGYRTVILGNGALCIASMISCAFISPAMPLPLIIVLLVFSGMTRSMQFTTIGTLTFADVPKSDMADANGLSNTLSQVSMAAGITLAAFCIRAGHAIVPTLGLAGTGAAYHVAFVLAAVVVLLGLIDAVRLPRDAGDAFLHRDG